MSGEKDRAPFQIVPPGARRILDVGCSDGILARRLAEEGRPARVYGIEIDPARAALAREVCAETLIGNAETIELPFEPEFFDCIAFFDALEHFVDPWTALARYSRFLAPGGVIVASVPNIRYFDTFARLLRGRWEYEETGLFDRGHLRFFTKKSMLALFNGAGLDVTEIRPGVKKEKLRKQLSALGLGFLNDFYTLQYWITAKKRA